MGAQLVLEAKESAPLLKLVVDDRGGGGRIEPPVGGLDGPCDHRIDGAETTRRVGLPLDMVVGAIGKLRVALPGSARPAGGDVDDPGDVFAVLRGQASNDHAGVVDDLRLQELLEPVLDRGRQLDAIDAKLQSSEIAAHVDGAVVVGREPGLGGQHGVELLAVAAGERRDVLPVDHRGAGAVLGGQRRLGGLDHRAIARATDSRQPQLQVGHGPVDLQRMSQRSETRAVDLQDIGPRWGRREAEAPRLIRFGRIHILAGGAVENDMGTSNRLAVGVPNLTLDLGFLLGLEPGLGFGVRPPREHEREAPQRSIEDERQSFGVQSSAAISRAKLPTDRSGRRKRPSWSVSVACITLPSTSAAFRANRASAIGAPVWSFTSPSISSWPGIAGGRSSKASSALSSATSLAAASGPGETSSVRPRQTPFAPR